MSFNLIIEEPTIKAYETTIERIAIRAIIMVNHRILLVQSNRGDYKFPGGGLEGYESHEECLIREVREETGYIQCMVKTEVGTVIERKMDEYDTNALFQMTSHYYLCDLASEVKITQQLDKYEEILDFTPKWVSLPNAIHQNEILVDCYGQNSWLKRETHVLKQLEKMLSEQFVK